MEQIISDTGAPNKAEQGDRQGKLKVPDLVADLDHGCQRTEGAAGQAVEEELKFRRPVLAADGFLLIPVKGAKSCEVDQNEIAQ